MTDPLAPSADMQSSPLWHPFTQHGLEDPMLPIEKAHGAWLETADGDQIYDAISSWWVTTHSHTHPRIVAAVKEIVTQLDQVVFAGLTHAPAEHVARELVAMAPAGLAHVFFSDSGSTAVEVALKMALGYWRNLGIDRTGIIALDDAYHGDTVGTMSPGARGVFNHAYAPLLFDVTRIPNPATTPSDAVLSALDGACRKPDMAAFICEPLVLGAGGMLMYDADVLRQMHRICRANNVLFIADEVMTGFGRTGRLFASDVAGIEPDLMCVAKGLTGGLLPLAATLATAPIFDAHRSHDRSRMFFHSSSYTANPIACAAAAANLEIWRDEPMQERLDALTARQATALDRLASRVDIRNARQCGTITAFEVPAPQGGYLSDLALSLRRSALRRGVLLRPLGNTVYVMPPYCSSPTDITHAYDVIADCISELTS